MSTLLNKSGTAAQLIISALIVIAFLSMSIALLFVKTDFPNGVKEIALVFYGTLISAFKDVVGFYLGSSLSSQRKDEIKELAP